VLHRLTRAEIEAATAKLQSIIDEVCGRCELNCCFQGTMVGSDDARRIAKAAKLSAAFRERLVEGLRQRGAQLRKDLEGLERTAALIETSFGAQKRAEVDALKAGLEKWREFCEFLERDFEPEPEQLMHCLVFSGVRATVLRAMRAFPGGERVLPALAGSGTSFRTGRRGIKADRCLFHVNGCIVPTAKPHKCADFYCASDPGLIHDVVDRMTFDEFTLAHILPRTRERFLEDLEIEFALGRAFFEPKVIVGGDGDLAETCADLMREAFGEVHLEWIEGGHLDVAVDLPDVKRPLEEEGLVVHCGSIDAIGIYEMAVDLVRARGASLKPALMVFADELSRESGVEHPLWSSRAMAQPLSAVNLVAIV
jgi:hypothetical protein